MTARAIDDDVLAVLSECTVQRPGTTEVVIFMKLDRPVYERVNKVLVAVGGKWDRKRQAHVFASDTPDSLAEKLDGLLDTGEFVDLKKAYGDFPSPPAVVEAVVRAAGIAPGSTVLEPSCGRGNLLRAASAAGGDVWGVEIGHSHALAVTAAGFGCACADFLTVRAGDFAHLFDRVVMNPPFAAGAAIDHVRHAWYFLKPGGRLVAVMPAGVTFRTDRHHREFAKWAACFGTHEPLPDNAFAVAGTAVRTVLLTLDKPVDL